MRRYLTLLLLLVVSPVLAQDCPALLADALAACAGMLPGEICYGSAPAVFIGEGAAFSTPGDTVLISTTRALATAPESGVVVMRAAADDDEALTLVLLGDAAAEFDTATDALSISLQTGVQDGCGSGLYLETEAPLASVTVNGGVVSTSGRAWITADDTALRVQPLDGPAQATDGETILIAGEGEVMTLPLEDGAPAGPLTLTAALDTPPFVADNAPTLTVSVSSANVRAGDSTAHGIVSTVLEGEQLAVVGTSRTGSGWLQVRFADGRVGWMSPVTFTVSGDLSDVPSVAPPPAPPPAPPTATPPAMVESSGVDSVSAQPLNDGPTFTPTRVVTYALQDFPPDVLATLGAQGGLESGNGVILEEYDSILSDALDNGTLQLAPTATSSLGNTELELESNIFQFVTPAP